jgi:archaellum component FlaF (FlaF/FlaG flagellin family)
MKPAVTFYILAALFLVAIMATSLAVYGGTADDPEVGDASGDSTTSRDSHDITAAWIEAEDNSTITFHLGMVALDAISPRDDWLNLPTSIYEYYFSIGEENYAIRGTVPVHGPFAALASFGLYTVEYGSSGNMSYNVANDQISGTYVVNEGHLQWMIDKSNIGSPSQGELVEHMWAAAYFQPRDGSREEVDSALSYDFPGRTYVIRGQFAQLYDVRLSATNTTIETPNNAVASFNITIRNRGTTMVEVNMTNRTLPAGYYVNWSRTMPISVPEDDFANLVLLVTVPENATNSTNQNVIIWGTYLTEEDVMQSTEDLNLLLQVRFIPPKKPKVKTNIGQQILDWIKENPMYIGLIAVAAVVGAVAYLLWARKKKADQMLIDQYKSYVDSQGQQRETGGPY